MKIAELLRSLSEGQVQYVMVGGLAVQLHGFMRSTFDVDLVLAMNDENLVRFIEVAKRFGLTPSIPVSIDALRDASQIEQWHREKGMLAFSLREPQIGGGVVDVLVRPEVSFEQLKRNAVVGALFAQQVWIASIDDLLTMKRAANRPNGHGKCPTPMMMPAMPVSPYPTFPRKREKGQTNRCASFTLTITSTLRRWRRSSEGKTRMAEPKAHVRETIPEKVMLGRLAQSEQMRDFFIQMWRQNPLLAKQGGPKVQSLLTPLKGGAMNERVLESSGTGMAKQRGISLIELIMFIVIISVALTGILLVMTKVTSHSADPLLHKQAIAAAESLLEEIELQDFISASTPAAACPQNAVTQANRASGYHIVCDYDGFSTALTGIHPVSGSAAIGGLGSYNATVAVKDAALGDIVAGSAVLITVTVTDPQGTSIPISSYRTAY